jgi:hypothetical protein
MMIDAMSNIHYALALTSNLFLGHENEETTLGEARLFDRPFFVRRGEWKAVLWDSKAEKAVLLDDELIQPTAEDEDANFDEGESDDHDGQPDEMQEWHDFDPDC